MQPNDLRQLAALPLTPAADAAQPAIAAAAVPSGATAPADAAEHKRVQDAAVKFEGMFIRQLLQQMRKSNEAFSDEDSIFNNRRERDMLDFADGQVADSLATQRAFGIADMLVKQLLPGGKG
ncbi:rod-binding protein [Vogesella oryzae]|uniref:rod-binding protein n=1 Tax=Vogesella oryzae TaxID=1735285 RepID=UPI0015831E9D|nr:rod-binding protein [Vogesella oryzae]